MQKAIRLCALALLAAETYAYTGFTSYVNGHADDWILFRGEKAIQDGANSNNKVVIITATAGDNGAWKYPHTAPFSHGGDDVPYWQGREMGQIEAVKKIYPTCAAATSVTRNSHPILSQTCGNIVNYFMRLPDGKSDGNGDDSTGYVSLKKLQAGTISSITAIDGSTTYTGWTDFYTTIKSILDYERPTSGLSGTTSWINVPQIDATVNPNDHSDHRAVSQAVDAIAPTSTSGVTTGLYGKAEYLTYCTNPNSGITGCTKPDNINSDDKHNMHIAYWQKIVSYLDSQGQNSYGDWVESRSIAEWGFWGNKSYYTPIYRSCYPSCTA